MSVPLNQGSSDSRRTLAPDVSMTGLGYEYVRCQRAENDDTVYVHQLCAIAGGADPHDVFSHAYEVHHICPVPWLNTPENVESVPIWEHREKTLSDDYPVGSGEVYSFDSPDEAPGFCSPDR
ncbi:hypothetical protein ACOZ4N_19315 [Halorientalis pallida]|jgi:hypothetical protein|uniref:hypothetical protein n=1 Tax=Halorientalis pallida TaxID=2479928 RepID=UPI003C6F4799